MPATSLSVAVRRVAANQGGGDTTSIEGHELAGLASVRPAGRFTLFIDNVLITIAFALTLVVVEMPRSLATIALHFGAPALAPDLACY